MPSVFSPAFGIECTTVPFTAKSTFVRADPDFKRVDRDLPSAPGFFTASFIVLPFNVGSIGVAFAFFDQPRPVLRDQKNTNTTGSLCRRSLPPNTMP
jgi:hypothetical protein